MQTDVTQPANGRGLLHAGLPALVTLGLVLLLAAGLAIWRQGLIEESQQLERQRDAHKQQLQEIAQLRKLTEAFEVRDQVASSLARSQQLPLEILQLLEPLAEADLRVAYSWLPGSPQARLVLRGLAADEPEREALMTALGEITPDQLTPVPATGRIGDELMYRWQLLQESQP